ncbi:hypothetical protein B7Z28_02065, partial [Candidatus Saccharibacteria bacterium 32-45-3]
MDQNLNQKPVTSPPPVAAFLRRPRVWRKALAFLVIAILGSFLAGYAGYYAADSNNPSTYSSSLTSRNDGNTITSDIEESVASVAEKVAPSVVSIITETNVRSYYGTTREGAGTGVVVSADGYVLTNKHVVDGASTVSVVTTDGTTYDNVDVVGSDPLNDVAFLKISDVKNLKPIEFGNSSTVRIGQEV